MSGVTRPPRGGSVEAPGTQSLFALAIDADISFRPRFNGEAAYKVQAVFGDSIRGISDPSVVAATHDSSSTKSCVQLLRHGDAMEKTSF